MSFARHCSRAAMLAALVAWGLVGTATAVTLISDGDFSATPDSKILRRDNKGQDWYESRRDQKGSRVLLRLVKADVGGNVTPKAKIQAHPDMNTYLSQKLAAPQSGDFTVRFDIFVQEILPDDNRSAFFMVGNDKDGKGGPNSTAAERFVFLGFENAATPGKMNLFAREGKRPWEQKTAVARDLDLNKWHTVEVTVYPEAATYEVSLKGVTPQPVELEAFAGGGKPPKKLTQISFASWNDGAGTFYVDNVAAFTE